MDFDQDLEKSVSFLENGGTILYPTDTVWGIGCDATNTKAVEKIFRIKNRIEAKSLIILLDHIDKLSTYIEKVPEITADLLASITNPVTIIYSNARRLAPNVVAPDGTIGIRIVKDDFCAELIHRFGKPIVSTSANISGETSPSGFSEISQHILDSVNYVVGYRQNDHEKHSPSPIIKIDLDGSIKIIRK